MWNRLDPYGIFHAVWDSFLVLFLLTRFLFLVFSTDITPQKGKDRG